MLYNDKIDHVNESGKRRLIKSLIRDNVNLSLYKKPNTIVGHYGRDDNSRSRYKEKGRDPSCSHLIQETDYKNKIIQYKFNSLGLRGPEPNEKQTDKKILFAGGSFCFGIGENVENTFPYILSNIMNANYLNLSDVDSITELIPYLLDLENKFKPDYFVLCDSRFINEIDWIRMFSYKEIDENSNILDIDEIINDNTIRRQNLKLFDMNNIDNYISKNELKRFANQMFEIEAVNTMLMFDCFCKDIFGDIPMVFVYFDRKIFTAKEFQFRNIKPIKITQKEVLDMARDNIHPGPKTNHYIANLVKSKLEE